MAAACGLMKEKQKAGATKFGKWLKRIGNSLTQSSKKSQNVDVVAGHDRKPLTEGTCQHQSAQRSRKHGKPHAASQLGEQQSYAVDDDCSQARASSDQSLLLEPTTAAGRLDEHTSEEAAGQRSSAGRETAAAHMAALRELLVTHIGQAKSSSEQHAQHSSRSPRLAGLTAKQALAADHMQLLDLVEVLISDHRTSLLERKRLQQQVDAAQSALQAVQLDKERAAARADVRSQEAHEMQQHLASAAAAAQQLHNRRTISSMRIQLPPAGSSGPLSEEPSQDDEAAAAAERIDSSPDLACPELTQQQSYGWRQSDTSAEAASSSRQAPLPKAAKAGRLGAGPALAAERSKGSRHTGSSPAPSSAVKAPPAAGTPSRAPRAAALSLRSAGRTTTGAAAAARGTPLVRSAAPGNARRLLGRTAGVTADKDAQHSQQVPIQAAAAGAKGQQQQQQEQHTQQVQPQQRWRFGGKLAPQPQHAAVPRQGQHASTAPGAAGPDKKQGLPREVSQVDHVMDVALRQSSCETLTSPLSMAAGPDAMLGITKEQLRKVVQRPWLQDTQEQADTTGGGAAADSSMQHAQAEARAGASHPCSGKLSCQQQQQQQSSGSAAADGSPGDAQSMNAVIASTSSCNGSVYASQLQPQTAPPAADSSSSSGAPLAAAGDTGSSAAPAQQRRACRGLPAVCSSNGSSWPGIKASGAAAAAGATGGSQGGPTTQQQPAARPSPLKPSHASIRLRGRSRAQPQQLSTSLESAATLGVAAGVERSSHGSSVADAGAVLLDGAAAWGQGSLEMVQEEQQHWQHNQQPLEGQDPSSGSSSSLGGEGSGMSRAGCGDHSSSGTAGPGGKHSGAQQTKQRRRWAAPSQVSAAEQLQGGSRHEQQQGHHQQQQRTHFQDQQRHPLAEPPAVADAGAAAAVAALPPAQAGEQQGLSRKHLQALAADVGMLSSAELSGGTSDIACMSITSAATGCTTLSGLAGVYLQHPSKPTKACPRPSFVPKLYLNGVAGAEEAGEDDGDASQPQAGPVQHPTAQTGPNQQPARPLEKRKELQERGQHQQQPAQQHQQATSSSSTCTPAGQLGMGAAAAAASSTSQQEPRRQQQQQQVTPSSSTGRHPGSARSYLTAEELADIAPLMAHPSSGRAARRHSSTGGTAVSPSPSIIADVTSSATKAAPAAVAAAAMSDGIRQQVQQASRAAATDSSSAGRALAGQAAAAAPSREEGSNPANAAPAAAAGTAGTAAAVSQHVVARAGEAPVAGEASTGTLPAARSSLSGGGASTRAYRPSSGGGSAGLLAPGAVGYWGSSAGSGSENPSRQPTPRVSDAAAAAGGGGGSLAAGRSGLRSRPSTAGNATAAGVAVETGTGSSSTQPAGHRASSSNGTAAGGLAGGVASRGVVLTSIPQPCAASATAAAATSFMTMRPAHLYRSVSTVYAMYSPLMGNLRALGHSRASHLSVVSSSHTHSHVPGTDPAAAAAVVPGHMPEAAAAGSSSHQRSEVPTFAGLASLTTTTTVLEPHEAPAGADMAAAMAAAAAAAHECHWQALLGVGCPPVPEEGAGEPGSREQHSAAAGAAGNTANADTGAAASAGLQPGQQGPGAAHADARLAQQEAHSSEAAHQYSTATTATAGAVQPVAAAAVAPTARPLSNRLQQRAHHLQVEVPEAFERDVIERGPVLPPASLSGNPVALSPHRPRNLGAGSPTRLLSPLAAAAAAVMARDATAGADSTGASSPLLAAAEAGAPVGPLTASSPTRLRGHHRSHVHSSSTANGRSSHSHSHHQHSRQGAGVAAAAAGQQQQQWQQPWQQGHQRPPRHRSNPVSPGRAAAIEAAAAAVAAHVAAAAQLIHRQEQRISNSQLLLQPEAPKVQQQQQQQQECQPMQEQRAVPLKRQQSQGVQVQMDVDEQLLAQSGATQQQPAEAQQALQMQPQPPQQQAGGLELDCSLCCFSPMSAADGEDGSGGWIHKASPHTLVAAASATVDSLMQQAELLGRQCTDLSHTPSQLQEQQQQQHLLLQQLLHGSSSSEAVGVLSPASSIRLAHQQQQRHSMPPPAPRVSKDGKRERGTPGSHHKRRSRGRWQLQQQVQHHHHNPLYLSQHSGPCSPAAAAAGVDGLGMEQHVCQSIAQHVYRTPPRSSRSGRSSSRQHSAVKPASAYRTTRTPPMSPGTAAAVLGSLEDLVVSTYQNPLLALEAAGLPSSLCSSLDTELLVSAALLPGLVEHLVQQASEASSFGGGGGYGLQGAAGSCDAAAGVSAAAVPVHMTPLAKDRSLRGLTGGQEGRRESWEGHGDAGGQLHWNPLFHLASEGVHLEGLQ